MEGNEKHRMPGTVRSGPDAFSSIHFLLLKYTYWNSSRLHFILFQLHFPLSFLLNTLFVGRSSSWFCHSFLMLKEAVKWVIFFLCPCWRVSIVWEKWGLLINNSQQWDGTPKLYLRFLNSRSKYRDNHSKSTHEQFKTSSHVFYAQLRQTFQHSNTVTNPSISLCEEHRSWLSSVPLYLLPISLPQTFQPECSWWWREKSSPLNILGYVLKNTRFTSYVSPTNWTLCPAIEILFYSQYIFFWN